MKDYDWRFDSDGALLAELRVIPDLKQMIVNAQKYDAKLQEDFTFNEESKAILDREIRQLQNKQVPPVKVLWQHHGMEEATWEPESTMRVQYPQLFSSGNFEDKIYFKEGRVVTPRNIP